MTSPTKTTKVNKNCKTKISKKQKLSRGTAFSSICTNFSYVCNIITRGYDDTYNVTNQKINKSHESIKNQKTQKTYIIDIALEWLDHLIEIKKNILDMIWISLEKFS